MGPVLGKSNSQDAQKGDPSWERAIPRTYGKGTRPGKEQFLGRTERRPETLGFCPFSQVSGTQRDDAGKG